MGDAETCSAEWGPALPTGGARLVQEEKRPRPRGKSMPGPGYVGCLVG